MLLHGLKGMHDRPIYLPRELSLLPDRGRIEERASGSESLAGSH